MPTSPVAILSDIHGNRWALEAVLDDVRPDWAVALRTGFASS